MQDRRWSPNTKRVVVNDLGMQDFGSVVLLQSTQELTQAASRLVVPVLATVGRFALELLLVLIMSTVTTVGLMLLDVPYAVVLGFVTGWLELIPIVGPITAGAIATIVALGDANPFGWTQLAYGAAVAVMYTVLRQAEDYFVIPFVIGGIVRLHPLVVIFSLLAGGAMLGLLGIILAVPAAAALRLVIVFVIARLRDEDPLASLEREIEEAQQAPAAVAVGEQVRP